MNNETGESQQSVVEEEQLPSKRQLLRDAVAFQIKLIIDGFRDFVLIPVSLIATVLSLLKPGDRAGSEFYDVVAFGKQTDEKINLFGAALAERRTTGALPDGDVDELIDKVEEVVGRELQGERFRQARERVERAMARWKAEGQSNDEL